jgi:uncharacterized protein YeaO (DUF488 family)
MEIRVKRVYDPPEASDGARILVDRLWPRGLAKDRAQLDDWLKDIAPTDALRKWFGHEPARWPEFRRRYEAELSEKPELVEALFDRARMSPITLLFATRDPKHNNAVALKEFLTSR